MKTALVFGVSLIAFLILDAIWIGVLMKDFYRQELGQLARQNASGLSPRWPAAFMVYVLIPAGLFVFVRPMSLAHPNIWMALMWGALFGLVVYGVYDLTNRAVLEAWSLKMTIADILWGMTICGLTSLAMRVAERWLKM